MEKRIPKTKRFPDKIFSYAGGGLGDIYYHYCQGWSYLEDIKKKYPNTKVHVACTSPNPKSEELLENHPFIDEVQFISAENRKGILLPRLKKPGYTLLRTINKAGLTQSKNIFLTKEDKEEISKIRDELGDKYIVIHPFTNDVFKKVKAGQ